MSAPVIRKASSALSSAKSKVPKKEAYAQMMASAGNLKGLNSLIPNFAIGRKTPGAS